MSRGRALHSAFTPALCAVAARGPGTTRPFAGASEQASEKMPEKSKNPTQGAKVQQLQFNTGGFIIPHPQKVQKGGEDAFFIATNQRSFGVADGVGGWVDSGVDPGKFARCLMREARKAAEAAGVFGDGALDSFQILCTAFSNSVHVIGSSTACVVCLNNDTLIASNIGDSGFLIIRDGKLLASTPPQQHRFNFPYQIGSKGNSVTSAQNFICKLLPGDIIVAGTDGLFDNVFSHRTTKLAWDAQRQGSLPSVAAQQIAHFASARSMDPLYLSPFAKAASLAGFHYRGGKVDDITVVVTYVSASVKDGGDSDEDTGDGDGGTATHGSSFSAGTNEGDVESGQSSTLAKHAHEGTAAAPNGSVGVALNGGGLCDEGGVATGTSAGPPRTSRASRSSPPPPEDSTGLSPGGTPMPAAPAAAPAAPSGKVGSTAQSTLMQVAQLMQRNRSKL